jgi:glucosamine-6-phosphate deaminase
MSNSKVEQVQLERSGIRLQYPGDERIPALVVDNFPHLGTLTALRFIEWVQNNPEGVIALPTGKTPEYFIHETQRILGTWSQRSTQRELAEWGIDTGNKPEMGGLSFVQIDEFYPINPLHTNSFFYYVSKYYIEGFGLDPDKALLINCEKIGLPRGKELEQVWDTGSVDLSLRYRNPANEKEKLQKQVLHNVDQWCSEYEDRIREKGGIGFFLGGIGPDGHIGFNIRGSDLHSTTRLSQINYETQAAASGDLGGIEVARERLVITIGLSTITYNPDCTAIIIAAGEAKAKIVSQAITEEKHILYPASVLQDLPDARFYITRGAAKYLQNRQVALFRERELQPRDIEKAVVDIALELDKSITDLTEEDYRKSDFGRLLLEKSSSGVDKLNSLVISRLEKKMKRGTEMMKGKKFLHTEPHHDDIMLGYLPFVVRHIREHSTRHHFVTLTSGFTAVTNAYMLNICTRMMDALGDNRYHFQERMETGYFDPENPHEKDRDVWTYLDGVTRKSEELKDEGTLRRFLRDLIEVFDERDIDNIRNRVEELVNYFTTQYPGKRDLAYIQKLKGMCREWESACLWGYFGWDSTSVENLRLGFYKGDIFTEEPTVLRDVEPVLKLIKRVKPDVVTVALDPEASGPDTHYKVLQTISEALKRYCDETSCEVDVIGYRNVWYRFHPSEASIFVPVSLNMLTLQESSFLNTYISQSDASFPSYEHDGPFTELSQIIQVEQYDMIRTCLGNDFFYEDESALIRATRGLVFLKQMKLNEFIGLSRELMQQTENR